MGQKEPVKTRRRNSLRKLAETIGFSKSALSRYMQRPGAPLPNAKGEYMPAEVVRFIDNEKRGGNELHAAKERKMVADAAMAELEVEQARARLIPIEDIADTINPLMAELAALLTQEFEMIAPLKYRGKSTAECMAINAAAVDRVVSRFREGAAPIIPKPTKPNKNEKPRR